jgi:hypothetical protein
MTKKTKKNGISRRSLLRGIGGAAVALPFLEIMHDAAPARAADIPKRYMVCVAGSSIGSGNIDIDETYVPSRTGFDYDLKTALAPLAGGTLGSGAVYSDVSDEVSVITDLRIPWASMNGGTVPAGGRPDNHHETMVSPLLCGVRTPNGQTSKCFGPTSDQVVADALGGSETLFHSLQFCVQLSSYLGGGGIGSRAMISYRDGGGIGSPGESIRPQTSPRQAWEDLFYNFEAEDPAAAEAVEFQRRVRQSVIDVVRGQAERLNGRLGRPDQVRLEQHFDEIRDLERRIATLGPMADGACMALDDPGADPAAGGNRVQVGDEYPYNISNGYSNEELRAEVFNRLVKMAFACDLTRSVSMMYSHFHSWMNVYSLIGRESDLHELGHSGDRHGSRGQAEILAWHYKHFAALVDDLRNTTEVDGSRLLDHCALVFTHEGGYGLDPSDGATKRSHSTERMACLVAGRAGGMIQGQHLRKSGFHPAQVLTTAMSAVGAGDTLGEVDGVIPELFG